MLPLSAVACSSRAVQTSFSKSTSLLVKPQIVPSFLHFHTSTIANRPPGGKFKVHQGTSKRFFPTVRKTHFIHEDKIFKKRVEDAYQAMIIGKPNEYEDLMSGNYTRPARSRKSIGFFYRRHQSARHHGNLKRSSKFKTAKAAPVYLKGGRTHSLIASLLGRYRRRRR